MSKSVLSSLSFSSFLEFFNTYPRLPDWIAVLQYLENSGTASYGFFSSSDSRENGYLMVSTNADMIDMEQIESVSGFKFGYLAYDLKNRFEQLSSENPDEFNWPDAYWIKADLVIRYDGNNVYYSGDTDLFNTIIGNSAKTYRNNTSRTKISLEPETDRAAYLRGIRFLQDHIQKGNVYELNYCCNYKGTGRIDPVETYRRLDELTAAPFSAMLKIGNRYILCGSPERFLRKTAHRLLSQPIKGTAARYADVSADSASRMSLQTSGKERSENIMIVDLVRNDMSRIAKKGSVTVEELCGVYSFRTVHQLISSVVCDVREGLRFMDVLRAMFPMGSMTGAPKISAMELIEEIETFRRGVYSGSIGYMTPEGDFDLNVVIRSILYDSEKEVFSAPAGGAITIESDPESEYRECLLKSEAMQKALK